MAKLPFVYFCSLATRLMAKLILVSFQMCQIDITFVLISDVWHNVLAFVSVAKWWSQSVLEVSDPRTLQHYSCCNENFSCFEGISPAFIKGPVSPSPLFLAYQADRHKMPAWALTLHYLSSLLSWELFFSLFIKTLWFKELFRAKFQVPF